MHSECKWFDAMSHWDTGQLCLAFGGDVWNMIMTNCCDFDLDPVADPDFRGHYILTLASMAKTYIFPMAQDCCHFWLKSHQQLKEHTITHCWAGNDADPGCDPDFVQL